MKSITKRLLSVFLSAVLVLATVPCFTLTAAAENDSLLAQYFTTDNVWYDTVSKSGNALQWVEGDYPAYQNGFTTFGSTYVRIANQSLFANVNSTTGLTVSFKYYSTESDNYRHILSLGKNMASGSADHLYISANPSHIGGGTAPVIGYVDSNGTEHINAYPSGAPAFEANKMYDVTIVFTASTITYYINGAKYQMAGDNDSATYLAAFLNDASTFANNYIGYSRWNDPKFNGGIKNMRFYGKALSETEIVEEKYGVTASDLKNTFDGASVNRNNIHFNTVPYHTGAEVTQGYSNIVYAPSWSTSWSGDGQGDNYIEVGRISFKVAVPQNTVLAYDGVNDVTAPIVLESKANNTNDSSFRIHYVCSYSTKFTLMQNWQGYWRTWNAFDADNLEVEEDFSNDSSDEHPSDDSQRDSTSRFWWNSLGYSGTGNTTDYYDVDRNLSYYAKTSYNQNGTRNYKYGDIHSIGNYYVVNFKPVYDMLPSVYSNYTNNIENKEWMYTEESLSKMMLALYLLGRSNPNTWNYSVNAEDAVTDCASTIRLAMRLYSEAQLVKKQFTVKFVKAGGEETTKTITAGDPIGTLPANTATTHIDGTTTHNVYSWGTTSDTVVQSDTTYNEQNTAVNCTFVPGYVWPTATTNGYTDYTCSVCNFTDVSQRVYDIVDWSAYDNAVADYNATINDANYAAKYTAASRSSYETAVQNAMLTKDGSIPASTVNAAAATITAAKSNLVLNQYTVKFVKAGGAEITRTVTAGETVGALPANSAASHIDGTSTHNVYSWGNVTADTVVYENKTYNEQATPANCTFRGSHTAATAELNGYTDYTCSACNYTDASQRAYDQTDWTDYDAAVLDYNATISAADYTTNYTATSRNAYETRVQAAQITKADSVPQTKINAAAAEITAAKSELATQQYTVKFVKANGDEITKTVNAGAQVGELPANSAASHIDGTTTHNVYSWGVTPTTVINENKTYNEQATPANCTFRGSHTAATAELNGYTDYTCSVCNFTDASQRAYDQTDWSAYDAAVLDYNATISDADYTADYSAASRNAYESRVQAAQIAKADTVPQTKIDAAAAEIIEAKGELATVKYNVAFKVYVDGAEQYTSTKEYGANTSVTLDVPSDYTANAEVYKWTYSVDSAAEETINTKASSTTYIACADAEYKAYLTTGNEAVPATSAKVSVYGMSDTVTDIGYVEKGSYNIVVDGKTITIGNKSFKAKDYAFYGVSGFEIGDESYTSSEAKSLNIEDDIIIRPDYVASGLFTINFSGCYEKMNPEANSIDAPFDQKLEVTADDADDSTAWYLTDGNNKKTLIGYGKSVKTYVTCSATVSKANNASVQPNVALEYFGYSTQKANTTTVIGSYYLPEGYEFVEAGFVLKTDRSQSGFETTGNYTGPTTLTASQLTTANATGVFKATGIADTNQFMFNISRTANTQFVMGARTYLKYRYNGSTNTIYSDMRLIAYAG